MFAVDPWLFHQGQPGYMTMSITFQSPLSWRRPIRKPEMKIWAAVADQYCPVGQLYQMVRNQNDKVAPQEIPLAQKNQSVEKNRILLNMRWKDPETYRDAMRNVVRKEERLSEERHRVLKASGRALLYHSSAPDFTNPTQIISVRLSVPLFIRPPVDDKVPIRRTKSQQKKTPAQ